MTEPMMKFFEYEEAQMTAKLRGISRRFYDLANGLITDVPRNAERTVALRKLLEAKDCAVRAVVPDPEIPRWLIYDDADTIST